jgi:hypothetical protein
MGAGDLSITAFLVEISTRLDAVAARARAALSCAQSGSEKEALRIAMDIDEVIYEVKMLHGAMRLAARSGRDRATS